ncbi:MAG: galactokinase [Cyclobacteriaceae bacterium]|nr:galactokinase [Cyclobacteriaceae bacterium]
MDHSQLLSVFKSRFQSSPRIFRSPGRINIIGEHTDYNDGFVLPAGVDREIVMVIGSNNSDQFNVYSLDEGEEVSFTLNDYTSVSNGWAQYIIGIIDQLKKAGHTVPGIDCVFGGDIPIGAGMSSSAALECATLYGLNELFGFDLDKQAIALMSQKAENEYVGVNCGIMDQFASVFSEEKKAIRLDCRDLSYELFDLDLKDYQLVLVDSMVKHSLASSEYNVRRAECEEGVALLNGKYPNVTSLRDATITQLESVKEGMKPKVYKRCNYMINEISRVTKATEAMNKHDLKELGRLLYETHEGLQHEFEVSCEELDFLVNFTKNREEVLGARMMGGGFGGCSINLIKTSMIEVFSAEIQNAYKKEFGKESSIYMVNSANGTSEIIQS